MYKDKDKQREANRLAQARFKAKGITNAPPSGITSTRPVIPNNHTLHPAIIAGINRLTTNPDGTVDQQARAIRMAAAKSYQRMYPDKHYTGVGMAPGAMPASPILIRVSKPGDADYVPLCQFTRDWVATHG